MTVITVPRQKSPQQRYLEQVVSHVLCACGCGSIVAIQRRATFPSYVKNKKHKGRFIVGHNIVFDAAKRKAACTWPSGPKARHWKGGRWTDKDGYVWLTMPSGKIAEHRLAVGAKRGEIVHHKNRNREDNDVGNLEVTTRADHAAAHALSRIRDSRGRFAGQYVRRIRKVLR